MTMKRLLLIGVGAGDPEQLTLQAVKALNRADVFFLLDKGASKTKLLDLRRDICERYVERSDYRVVEAELPERERGVADYAGSVVDLNAAKQALFERLIDEHVAEDGCGAFLVWGDPALYDSSIRILDAILASGRLRFDYEVIPGITSVQALAARHRIPLNHIGGAVQITTGRRLAREGLPAGVQDVVVMLDAQDSYTGLRGQDLEIFWGAYVGTPDELLIAGRLDEVAERIRDTRLKAREANGWIMDTYLLRRVENQ